MGKIRYTKNTKKPRRCEAKTSICIRVRAQRLEVKQDRCIAVNRDSNKNVKLTTDKDIVATLQDAVRVVYHITNSKALKKLHSLN